MVALGESGADKGSGMSSLSTSLKRFGPTTNTFDRNYSSSCQKSVLRKGFCYTPRLHPMNLGIGVQWVTCLYISRAIIFGHLARCSGGLRVGGLRVGGLQVGGRTTGGWITGGLLKAKTHGCDCIYNDPASSPVPNLVENVGETIKQHIK